MFEQLNNKGSSLLQVLIGSAMVMAISLGVAELIVTSNKAQKANAIKFSWSLAQNQILSLISNKDMCTQSITSTQQYLDTAQANTPQGHPISFNSPNGDIYQAQRVISNGDLRIKTLSIKSPSKITDLSGSRELWSVKLNMSAESTRDLIGGRQFSNDLDIGMFLTVDASNKAIQDCSLTPNDDVLSGVCLSMGGSFDNTTGDCTMPQKTAQQSCQELGGTYNTGSGKCEIAPNPATVCTTLGGTYSGGSCKNLPSSSTTSFANLRFRCPSRNDSSHGCSSTCSGQTQTGATCEWYECNATQPQHREHGHRCNVKHIVNCTAI